MVDLSLFNEKFGTEEKCRDFLVRSRWPYGFRCPVCGGGHYYYVQTRQIYECQCCRTQTSFTSGTLFHGTRLPLQYWFLTMYLLSNDVPCSARWLSVNLQLHYRTASRLLRSIRECMMRCNEYWTNHLIEHVQTCRLTEADGDVPLEGLLRELLLSIEEDEAKKAIKHMASEEIVNQADIEHTKSEDCGSVQAGSEHTKFEDYGSEQGGSEHTKFENCDSAQAEFDHTMFEDRLSRHMAPYGLDNPAAAIAIDSQAVNRAWKLAAKQISAYIRSLYRKVHRRYLKSYMEEFYFRTTGRFNTYERFWELARTSTAAFIPAST